MEEEREIAANKLGVSVDVSYEEALKILNPKVAALDALILNTPHPEMKQKYVQKRNEFIHAFNVLFPGHPVPITKEPEILPIEPEPAQLPYYEPPKELPVKSETGDRSAPQKKIKWHKLAIVIFLIVLIASSLFVIFELKSDKSGRLLVHSDSDCIVYIDGIERSRLSANQERMLSIPLGDHVIKAVGVEMKDSWQDTVRIYPKGQMIVDIKLQSITAKRVALKKAEKEGQRKQKEQSVNQPVISSPKEPQPEKRSLTREQLVIIRDKYNRGRQEYDQGNYFEAVGYLEYAAKLGDVMAQCYLHYIYMRKETGSYNLQKAKEWALKAVNHQDNEFDYSENKTNLMYNLGLIYGLFSDKKNYIESEKWFRKAAKRGHSDAQYNLGLFELAGYVSGRPNPIQAEYWLLASSKQGNEKALEKLFQLGMMYYNGDTEGVPKDIRKAKEIWEELDAIGYWKASSALKDLILENY
ncbi:MAG: hypothetical protein DKINENOH_04872 [bacterium]|nr:hypothetical protein [bacterium]